MVQKLKRSDLEKVLGNELLIHLAETRGALNRTQIKDYLFKIMDEREIESTRGEIQENTLYDYVKNIRSNLLKDKMIRWGEIPRTIEITLLGIESAKIGVAFKKNYKKTLENINNDIIIIPDLAFEYNYQIHEDISVLSFIPLNKPLAKEMNNIYENNLSKFKAIVDTAFYQVYVHLFDSEESIENNPYGKLGFSLHQQEYYRLMQEKEIKQIESLVNKTNNEFVHDDLSKEYLIAFLIHYNDELNLVKQKAIAKFLNEHLEEFFKNYIKPDL